MDQVGKPPRLFQKSQAAQRGAGQEKRLAQVTWVQYNAQWNLLTTSLPREGVGCTQQAMQSLVGTTERLAQMIASAQ